MQQFDTSSRANRRILFYPFSPASTVRSGASPDLTARELWVQAPASEKAGNQLSNKEVLSS